MKPSHALGLAAIVATLSLPALTGSVRAAEDEPAASEPAGEAAAEPAEEIPAEFRTPPETETETGFDRSRGVIAVSSEDGNYEEGSHFAKWFWSLEVPRWGMYNVNLVYTSTSPKIGIQAKIGDFPALKTYVPRTAGDHHEQRLELGRVYIDEAGEYPLMLLTGDKSNGPAVFIKGVELVPAPESSPTHQSDQSEIITRPHSGEIGQSIDGNIELPAGGATTWSERMRYEPKEEKNCLGFWSEIDDWAEWTFTVHSPGRYKIEVVQGCGEGQGGSEVEMRIGSDSLSFEVVDTGGFQEWENVEVGFVDLNSGSHTLAVKPVSKAAKAVFDIHKIVLTPAEAE